MQRRCASCSSRFPAGHTLCSSPSGFAWLPCHLIAMPPDALSYLEDHRQLLALHQHSSCLAACWLWRTVEVHTAAAHLLLPLADEAGQAGLHHVRTQLQLGVCQQRSQRQQGHPQHLHMR